MALLYPSSSDGDNRLLAKLLQNGVGPETYFPGESTWSILRKLVTNQAGALAASTSDTERNLIAKLLINNANAAGGGGGGGGGGGSVTLGPTIPQSLTASKFNAVYSMARRVIGYTGPLIRTRRSTDNDRVDHDSMEDFRAYAAAVPAAIYYLERWYDQSGNNRLLHRDGQTTRQARMVYPYAAFGSHGAAYNDGGVNGYLECASSLTARSIITAGNLIANQTATLSGLVCNRDSETLEIRQGGTYGTWDTSFNFTANIYRYNTATAAMFAQRSTINHFRRTSDATFAAPWVLLSGQISLNRPFIGEMTEVLVLNSTFDNAVSPISTELDALLVELDLHYGATGFFRYLDAWTLPQLTCS